MDHPNSHAASSIVSKDWTLERLLAAGTRFQTVDRISANSGTPEQIASIIKDHEQRNIPLVIQDLHSHPSWPEFFTAQWLEGHYGSQGTTVTTLFEWRALTSRVSVEVRNVHGEGLDGQSTVAELIDNLRNAPPSAHQGGTTCNFVTCDFTLTCLSEPERLHGKDIHCPPEWRNWISSSGAPPSVVIPGAAGDVLPESIETFKTYLGVSDTCTYTSFPGSFHRSFTPCYFSSHAVAQGPLRVLRA
jgi:hypothetical protein